MFSREKLEGFAERMRYATICESRAHSAYKPNRSAISRKLYASQYCAERNVCVFIIIKKYIWILSQHKMRLVLFLIQTLLKPGQSMLASALETMSLREIGPQLKFPR